MTVRILSVDGGGIRGIGPANVLCHLDDALGGGLAQRFDLVVGTSTGCIIAAGMAANGQAPTSLTPKAIRQLYYDRGAEMFTRALWGINPAALVRGKYREQRKGQVLREVLGELTLGALERNFLGTFYNVGDAPGPMFLNGGARYRAIDDDDFATVPLWRVANASSDAPIYFDPEEMAVNGCAMRGVDGGLFANNPAMCAYVEARKIWPDDRKIVVVSLGCGRQHLRFPRRKRWGLLNWASPWAGMPLLEAMFDGQSEAVTHQMERIGGDDFLRLDFDLDPIEPARLDDVSRKNLDAVVAATDKLVKTTGAATFAKIVEALSDRTPPVVATTPVPPLPVSPPPVV